VKERLQIKAKHACNEIAEKLLKYLESPEVKTKLMTWEESDAPDVVENDMEVTVKKGMEVYYTMLLLYVYSKSQSQNERKSVGLY